MESYKMVLVNIWRAEIDEQMYRKDLWTQLEKVSVGQFERLPLKHQRGQWQPTPVLLPGKSHWWRTLVGCSPWGRKDSDTTEQLHFHFSLSGIGEGNGNPLQCSCLENPRDGGAWWATVYGVTQSRTRLKWLSNSSSSRSMCPIDPIELTFSAEWNLSDSFSHSPLNLTVPR